MAFQTARRRRFGSSGNLLWKDLSMPHLSHKQSLGMFFLKAKISRSAILQLWLMLPGLWIWFEMFQWMEDVESTSSMHQHLKQIRGNGSISQSCRTRLCIVLCRLFNWPRNSYAKIPQWMLMLEWSLCFLNPFIFMVKKVRKIKSQTWSWTNSTRLPWVPLHQSQWVSFTAWWQKLWGLILHLHKSCAAWKYLDVQ